MKIFEVPFTFVEYHDGVARIPANSKEEANEKARGDITNYELEYASNSDGEIEIYFDETREMTGKEAEELKFLYEIHA